ncbi:MAG: right-handed parallel beta-helix repeat-containing protein, partial [Planctomycetota bacterium]
VPLTAQLIPHPEERKTAIQRNYTEVKAASYQLTFRGGGIETNRLMRLSTIDSTDQVLPAKRVPRIDATAFELIHEAVTPAPVLEPQRWSGEMVFEDVRTILEDVIIAPGTTLRMGPGASIIFEGQLLARGTKAEPIRVLPKDEGQLPWGVLAVRGEGANQSTISFVEMTYGSGLKTVPAEFSAMLSIHDAKDVLVEDCVFTDSQVVDDMVHAVYSTIRFERCKFVRSLMDALDIDISEAVVADCEFIESGNDSLDLMTSTVVAYDITTVRSGDKGVSVGEDTTALLLRCSLLDGNIGVEMKDRSRATFLNCLLRGNEIGINAYKKNWRYDSGGFGNVYNSIIEKNVAQVLGDKFSSIQVHDSFVRPLPDLDEKMKRRVHL